MKTPTSVQYSQRKNGENGNEAGFEELKILQN